MNACRPVSLRLGLLVLVAATLPMASCRSLMLPAAAPLATITSSELADGPPASLPETAALPLADAGEQTASEPRAPLAAVAPESRVERVGLEVPCPPLPRVPRHQCGRAAPLSPCGPTGSCQACQGPSCQPESCQPEFCAPPLPPPPVPVVGPYLVCDGGDHRQPAQPVGRHGIANLTSGDTVARYRADDGTDCEEACLVASNCTCVYAPRFSSVRQITRPFEDAAGNGPRGVAHDTLIEAGTARQPVCGKTQHTSLVAARRALPGLAVEERLPPLAVDRTILPYERDGVSGPAARVNELPPERFTGVQAPAIKKGFAVPYAWMCVSAAQVTVSGEAADVVAVDHGTATLRLEEPGRCELTLCKRAGSDTARPGEELDFTIFLLNAGDRPLTDIVLVDAVPQRLKVIEGSPASNLPADISTSEAPDGSVLLKWRMLETLRPGEGGFVRFRTIVH